MNSSDAEAGFTGLEAALVLIAFVVIASIFTYVFLSAGFHFSDETQSTIHQSVCQAGSGCMVDGEIRGVTDSPDFLKNILVPICLTAGGDPIDITTISIRFAGSKGTWIIEQNNPLIDAVPEKAGYWSVEEWQRSNSNHLLEAGESCVLNISPPERHNLRPHCTFSIEIKPAGRVALRIEKTIPGKISELTPLGR